MQYHHKTKQDLINLLQDKGQPIDGKKAYICPFCHSGTKANKTSGFSIFQDSKTSKGRYKCFACGENGDFYDLYHYFTGQPYAGETITQIAPLTATATPKSKPFRHPELIRPCLFQ